MREILFRGKRVDTGEWVTGVPLVCDNWTLIVKYNEKEVDYLEEYKVNPATVGQATGLTDKHGKKIFEGDIVRNGYANHLGEFFDNGVVVYVGNDGCWEIANEDSHLKRLTRTMVAKRNIEIIGNVHDNPESLEGGTHDSP